MVFVASPLVKHHQGLRAKTGGFGNKYLKSHNYQEMLDCFALHEETTMTLHQEGKFEGTKKGEICYLCTLWVKSE